MTKIDEDIGSDILADVLKNPPLPDRDMTFHYSRDNRLQRATQAVQDMNQGKVKRGSAFGSFTATRSHAVLLVSIVALCVFISIITRVTADRGVYTLEGNSLAVSALRYEGRTFVVIKKTGKEGAYTGAVDVALSRDSSKQSGQVEQPIFTERLYFTPELAEDFRLSLPLEIPSLVLLLQSENARAVIQIKAE